MRSHLHVCMSRQHQPGATQDLGVEDLRGGKECRGPDNVLYLTKKILQKCTFISHQHTQTDWMEDHVHSALSHLSQSSLNFVQRSSLNSQSVFSCFSLDGIMQQCMWSVVVTKGNSWGQIPDWTLPDPSNTPHRGLWVNPIKPTELFSIL